MSKSLQRHKDRGKNIHYFQWIESGLLQKKRANKNKLSSQLCCFQIIGFHFYCPCQLQLPLIPFYLATVLQPVKHRFTVVSKMTFEVQFTLKLVKQMYNLRCKERLVNKMCVQEYRTK